MGGLALGRPGLVLPRASASPDTIVRALPALPGAGAAGAGSGRAARRASGAGELDLARAGRRRVVREPPLDRPDRPGAGRAWTTPPCAPAPGSVLVLVPSVGWAERLTARLERRGLPGRERLGAGRAPAGPSWSAAGPAPGPRCPRLAAAVVLDAHDAAYREESAPTYSAVDVVTERARREGVPCIVASPVPARGAGRPRRAADGGARRGRRSGPAGRPSSGSTAAAPTRAAGMFSEEFVRLARSVLDDPARAPARARSSASTTARAAPACWPARTAASWPAVHRCGAAVAQPRGEEVLRCPRCGETRPVVCAACGRLRMKTLRAGVSRLREELAALLGVEVGEVAGPPGGRAGVAACPTRPS